MDRGLMACCSVIREQQRRDPHYAAMPILQSQYEHLHGPRLLMKGGYTSTHSHLQI